MKIFVAKLAWRSALFILIVLLKPFLAKIFGESFFAPIDYFLFVCVGAYFLASILMFRVLPEKKILSIILLLLVFIVSVLAAVYLTVVVWLTLGLSY